MNGCVFLDRDGTINEEVGYINHISRFRMLSGAAEAISSINKTALKAVVVTNQSGVARGYFPESLLLQVNELLVRNLKEAGAYLDGLYYCPHIPGGNIPPYNIECDCRKPKTGMLYKAAEELSIDLRNSYMVGDRIKDVEFGQNAGLKTVLLLTGYGIGEAKYLLPQSRIVPNYIAQDLAEAVRWILEDNLKAGPA